VTRVAEQSNAPRYCRLDVEQHLGRQNGSEWTNQTKIRRRVTVERPIKINNENRTV